MVEEFGRSGADAVIAFESVPREEVVNYGIAKPRGRQPRSSICKTSSRSQAWARPPATWPWPLATSSPRASSTCWPGRSQEREARSSSTDAIRALVQKGGRVIGMRLDPRERRFDIGNFESYFRAFIEFALADPRYGNELRQFVRERLDAEVP